jgi:hypothetical protein
MLGVLDPELFRTIYISMAAILGLVGILGGTIVYLKR